MYFPCKVYILMLFLLYSFQNVRLLYLSRCYVHEVSLFIYLFILTGTKSAFFY